MEENKEFTDDTTEPKAPIQPDTYESPELEPQRSNLKAMPVTPEFKGWRPNLGDNPMQPQPQAQIRCSQITTVRQHSHNHRFSHSMDSSQRQRIRSHSMTSSQHQRIRSRSTHSHSTPSSRHHHTRSHNITNRQPHHILSHHTASQHLL